MLIYRHGDVGIIKAAIPPTARKTTRKILAYGEVTGHSHAIAAEDVAGAEIYELDGAMFLRVTADGGISIVHEEHAPIQVAVGDYEIRIAKEYDEEGDFKVMD